MNKYGNKKAVRNGITFDSQKEAARYDQLMLRLCAGEIRDLKLQPEFTLQERSRHRWASVFGPSSTGPTLHMSGLQSRIARAPSTGCLWWKM